MTVSALVVLTELLLNLNLKGFKYDIVILPVLRFIEKLSVMALLKYKYSKREQKYKREQSDVYFSCL